MATSLAALVATSAEIAGTRSREAKTVAVARFLAEVSPTDAAVAALYLAGRPRQERLEVGWASLQAVAAPAVDTPVLTLAEVDAALQGLAGVAGPGSKAARGEALAALLARATTAEQDFLRRLILGDLRQGALEALVVAGLARAAGGTEAAARRAVMLTGDLGQIAEAALRDGPAAFDRFRLRLFTPVQPMLAATAADVADALAGTAGAAVEWKLDGARVQVHRRHDEVRVFTRNLRDATARNPEVVEAVRALAVDTVVLDGEVVALDDQGRPHAFQQTMSQFGRARTAGPLRLSPFFFDLLHVNGRDLLDIPDAERRTALEAVVPEQLRVPRTVAATVAAGERVLADALARGHEGVVVKALDAPYAAGRRGAAWQKVKPVHTLDLVVLAVEWGSGRRRGLLSNLHLGARDPDGGGFVMVGKTFKGLTDELLAWQTARFLELAVARDEQVVHVRPEQVVEVAFDGVQVSRRYDAGVTLRFARVRRYRSDKSAEAADTIAQVRGYLQAGR